MGKISKLDAINHMLLMAGESLVADLTDNSGLDTETAEFVLEQYIRDFQMRGLANNRYLKKYKLTSDGKIELPSTPYPTLSAELLSDHTNTDGYRRLGVARGPSGSMYMWDNTDQTDIWKAEVEYTVEIIQEIGWHDLDTPVQRAVLASAARQYQLVTQGDRDSDAYLGSIEAMYVAKGKGADMDDKRKNILYSSSMRMQEAIQRNISYNDPSRFRFWRTANPGS